jgi:death on curing protein
MTRKYLSKENILAIHKELISEFGGSYGLRDASLLESAVGRYQSGYYADTIEEAAALMESLGRNHPFIDGNKRIAVSAAFIFLMAHGYKVSLDEQETYVFIIGLLEKSEFSKDKLEPWIRASVIQSLKQ